MLCRICRDFFNIFPTKLNKLLSPLLKKKSEICPFIQVSAAAMTSASEEKLRLFNLYFQCTEQVLFLRAQIRIIGWVIKTLDAQVFQCLLGCKCQVSQGIVMQGQDQLGELPATFFPQNVPQLHQHR